MARFILLDRITKDILNPNIQPAPDVNQWINDMVSSLDPSLELVAVHEPYSMPLVDTRLINVTTNEVYSDTDHPVYSQLKTWSITYDTVSKTADEKKAEIDNKESEANETTVPSPKRLKYLVLALDNVIKLTCADYKNSELINAKKKKEIKTLQVIADKIRANSATKDAKNTIVDSGSNPDLDSDWLIDDFTENVTV